MLNFILTILGSSFIGNIFGFVKHFTDQREETKRIKMQTDSQIEIARLSSENSSATRRSKFKKMLEKHLFELKKMHNKPTGNKLVDAVKALMPSAMTLWVMGMATWIAMVMLPDPELRIMFCQYFLALLTLIVSFWFGGKLPSVPRMIRKR